MMGTIIRAFDSEVEKGFATASPDPQRDLERQAISALRLLSCIGSAEFAKHLHSTAQFALVLARKLQLSETDQENIWYAASVHDIGKVGIDHNILHKAGTLDPTEIEEVRNHTILGNEILSRVDGDIYRTAADVALSHHERWDGQGYPRSQQKKEISLAARIVAIADVFDCITAGRPYRAPQSNSHAKEELERCAGTQFDPELVSLFLGEVVPS